MGPYCKFCNNRCFKYTEKDDLIKTDLKATCREGIIFDMNMTYSKLKDSKGNDKGWLISLNRGGNYSLCAELFKGKIIEFEIENSHLEEIIDFTKSPKDNTYYYYIEVDGKVIRHGILTLKSAKNILKNLTQLTQ